MFVFWPTVALLKVFCGKTYCYDAKFTCPARGLVSLVYLLLINIPELEERMFVLEEQIHNG
jgi:energy-converting hydrogenase Eha subunit B